MGIRVNICGSNLKCLVPCACVQFGMEIVHQTQEGETTPDYCKDCHNSGWVSGHQDWMPELSLNGDIYSLLCRYLDSEYMACGTVHEDQLAELKERASALRTTRHDEREARFGCYVGNWPVSVWNEQNKLNNLLTMITVAMEKKLTLGMG